MHPLSIIMIDIDCFKAYNDTYGHLSGDDCLKSVASALIRTVKRPTDLVARFGGEEFIVVLPDTGGEGAAILAETLCEALTSLAIPHETSPVKDVVTVSIGVATAVPGVYPTAYALISAADRALYSAKQEGRNRVKVAAG
jgi:diguanylate cyclase (GGDEF)-like protein